MKLCGGCGFPISALLCASFAAGCATFRADSPAPAAEMKLTGAIVVRSDSAPARRAKMVWTRLSARDGATRDLLDIKTPFGTTQARVEIDADGMRILVGGKPAAAEDAPPALRLWLDMLPPPHSVGYWLAGESDPAYSAREVSIPGAPGVGRIYQHEWEVEFAERDENGRPSLIKMRPQSPPPDLSGAEAEVRIRGWIP